MFNAGRWPRGDSLLLHLWGQEGFRLAKKVHQVEIALRVAFGLGLADNRFPQDIHSKGNVLPCSSQSLAAISRFVIAQHELPGHAGDLRLDPCANQPGRAARSL